MIGRSEAGGREIRRLTSGSEASRSQLDVENIVGENIVDSTCQWIECARWWKERTQF